MAQHDPVQSFREAARALAGTIKFFEMKERTMEIELEKSVERLADFRGTDLGWIFDELPLEQVLDAEGRRYKILTRGQRADGHETAMVITNPTDMTMPIVEAIIDGATVIASGFGSPRQEGYRRVDQYGPALVQALSRWAKAYEERGERAEAWRGAAELLDQATARLRQHG